MSKWMIAVVLTALSGCAVPTADVDEGPTSEDEGALRGNPMGCDDWLNRCRAKGGTEETQPGGIRMCCRTNSSGKECISDPDSWPARPRPGTVKPVVTANAP